MSYDLSVWSVNRVISRSEAIATLKALNQDEALSSIDTLSKSSRVQEFVTELEQTYPQISSYADDDVDTCPWSCDFFTEATHVTLSCSYSRSSEIVRHVLPLAHRHELAVFDFATELIYLPPSLAPRTDCTLDSPWLLQSIRAYPEILPDIIAVLPKRADPYLVITREGEHYMQTLWTEDGFILEFRDGNADSHFRSRKHLDAASVTRAIQAYIQNTQWRDCTTFDRINL
jgi:hypothetical protein